MPSVLRTLRHDALMTRSVQLLTSAPLLALAVCTQAQPTAKETPPPTASPSSHAQLPFQPTQVAIGDLPAQESLYDVITLEFVRLGWGVVCVGIIPGVEADTPVDPPAGVVAGLKAHNAHFRPWSGCDQRNDDLVDRASGRTDAVAVTLVGADLDGGDTLVRVTWCCWVGLGYPSDEPIVGRTDFA
jgi:hypothetical protein